MNTKNQFGKKETGKTSIEHLQLYLLDEAKNLLNKTVSEVAYDLCFEYPPYFSRLFKKERRNKSDRIPGKVQNALTF